MLRVKWLNGRAGIKLDCTILTPHSYLLSSDVYSKNSIFKESVETEHEHLQRCSEKEKSESLQDGEKLQRKG